MHLLLNQQETICLNLLDVKYWEKINHAHVHACVYDHQMLLTSFLKKESVQK